MDVKLTERNICRTPFELLNKLTALKLDSLFPNVIIALRIFLTISVSVASGERSFSSKLGLVKDKLRNSTLQDRLVGLCIIKL